MNRKEALQMMALVGGGTIIGLDLFLSGCKAASAKPVNFSKEEIALLDQIGETIIPTTNTPGAKATKIGEFMQAIVKDCYTEKQQEIFLNGVSEINKEANKKFSKNFIALDPAQQNELLNALNKEANNIAKEKAKDDPHYFSLLRQLTIWGFFTSEIGQTQVLDYRPVPGSFNGSMPYKKGDKTYV